MIISASRRTDIPAYYSKWFLKRLKEGYVYVRNPMNPHQISKIGLTPDVVDGIVVWTKNPTPMLDHLEALKDYVYYFQFTLTSYGPDAETGVPNKQKYVIPAFQRLSDQIGPSRVIWRYDPIFLSETYTMEYHLRYFEELAKRLAPYTEKCTISFLDLYRKTAKNVACLALERFTLEQQEQLAGQLAEIAHANGLAMDTCAEGLDLEKYGITHASCIDKALLEKLLGCPLKIVKDKNQRPECGCMESIDIGAYNTCGNGCRYCYANFNEKAVAKQMRMHDPDSPLLLGNVEENDHVSEKKMRSYKMLQMQIEL